MKREVDCRNIATALNDWVGYNVGQAGWASLYDSYWPAGNALGTIP
jgi:hypothetical protein